MKKHNEKIDIKIKKFIDKNFGDEIEYCYLKEGNKGTLIYTRENEIIVHKIKSQDHLLQELIMLKEERDFLLSQNNEMLEEQAKVEIK